VQNRDAVPVGLCRKLMRVIGEEWGTTTVHWIARGTSLARLVYTTGDLIAFCQTAPRFWGVGTLSHPGEPNTLCTRPEHEVGIVGRNGGPPFAKGTGRTLPAALALAVIAAVEAESRRVRVTIECVGKPKRRGGR